MNNYILGFKKEKRNLSKEELFEYLKKYMANRQYILQKYISSKTKEGHPFDCRLHVQKNRQGKWQVARNFIRIGIGQKIVSNVNQGGGISDLKPFLKANFGEKWEDIYKRVDQLAVTLAYKLEEIKKTPIMTIGFDVAIDPQGKLYLFESNGAPTTAPLVAESAMLRTEYYLYVLENKTDKGFISEFQKSEEITVGNDNQSLKEELEKVKQEKVVYKKKYDAIKNSRTWRLTAPMRKVSKFLKSTSKNS